MENEPTSQGDIKSAIRRQELEQLKELDLVLDPDEQFGLPRTGFDDLKRWTIASIAQIQAGVNQKAFGGPFGQPIDWNCAFLTFMESAAVYLRDTSMVLEAVKKYKIGKLDEAFGLLTRATKEIDELAEMWNMHFVVVCDLVKQHPDGHSWIVGPYCGAFYAKDYSNPFVGFAFKGTSVKHEFINDLYIKTLKTPQGILYQTAVARGFYYPIFSRFGGSSESIPFGLVKKAFEHISRPAETSVVTHCTGHSLGGAYSSLCYGQLTIDGSSLRKFALGDLYTFGSPRIGLTDFAKAIRAAVGPPSSSGSSWRIANKYDYVTKVPASSPWADNPYTHIDRAYEISKKRQPKKLPSEIDSGPTWSFPTRLHWHSTDAYYESLVFTTTRKSPCESSRTVFNQLQLLGKMDVLKGAAKHLGSSVLLDAPGTFPITTPSDVVFQSMEMCTLGTVRAGAYTGELAAWGDASALQPVSATLHYRSWEQLAAAENEFVVSATGPRELRVAFTIDGALAAVAVVLTDADVDKPRISGRCVWMQENSADDAEEDDDTEERSV
ncbi:hypothetical protein B0H14DRAFT_3854974 [Mycena olivaceomarginata]|nr:hypothetical protein B0H14DRAFT_3854974 [Mycena olivaceomarginata]